MTGSNAILGVMTLLASFATMPISNGSKQPFLRIPIMIAGVVAEQCWRAMPPIRSRLIWHKVPDKALLMRPAFCAGWRMMILIRRYQAMRAKDQKRLA